MPPDDLGDLMRRRTVLALLAAGTAGCLSAPPGTDGTGTPATPGPDAPCPSFGDADRTVCYGRIDPGEADLSLEPSPRVLRVDPDDREVETVEFVLHNRGGSAFGFNPYDWAVKRRVDGGWEHVAPTGPIREPLLLLDPGGTYLWSLSRQEHPSPRIEDAQFLDLELAEGTYAFRIVGSFQGGEGSVEAVALFSVETEG